MVSPATFGSIVDAAGNTVTVADAPAPDGVHITVSGSGTAKSVFRACGFDTIQLAPPGDLILTCASVKLKVTVGVATVVLGGGITTISVPAGAAAEVSDLGGGKFTVANQAGSSAPVTVTTNGVPTTVAIGGTSTVPVVTVANLCTLTKQYVKSSAKYAALTAKQKQTIDASADAACARIQSITPQADCHTEGRSDRLLQEDSASARRSRLAHPDTNNDVNQTREQPLNGALRGEPLMRVGSASTLGYDGQCECGRHVGRRRPC